MNRSDSMRRAFTPPTHVPVNLLIRFLEAGHYQEGADLYDLYSCVECGLCSFVCVAKIPIFQYIKLAKHELNRMRAEMKYWREFTAPPNSTPMISSLVYTRK